MTEAERKLCDYCAERPTFTKHLDRLIDDLYDERHPKRTLADVERDLAKLCSEPLLASELWDRAQPLMNERQKLLDEEKES